jgi:hypothetical protein
MGEVSPSLQPGARLKSLIVGYRAPVLRRFPPFLLGGRNPLLGGRLDRAAARPYIVVAAPTESSGTKKCPAADDLLSANAKS